MDTFSMITGTTLNRYQLDIPSCTASLDVEEFSGAEKLSELYYYTITFTSAEKNIDAAQLLSKPAMLTMGGGALQQLADCKRVHGVVTAFRRISSSEDQSTYQITLQPFLSLLDKQFRSHRFFVNKSVPEVVEQVLQEHHLHDWEYEFNLKQHYPRREQINQYQESDLAFIQRLLAEVGIFYFFTLQEEAQSEVVHFADAQRALMFDKTLPVNSPSGMSDSGTESIWGLSITHNVVEANVTNGIFIMDDLTLRYFDAEMRYLREAAKAFAQAHPDRAAMLDLDKAGTPDPYVERLFEGFAFSVGRLREKIDDDLPELTEGLVSMLWPHYLRTIPSLSIVALTPTLPAMKMAETVPAGFEISSRPLGPKNTVCRYRTTRDLTLNPLAIEEAVMTAEPDGRSALRLRFACSELADWSQTDLRRLALYLGEDAVTGSALHLWLTRSQAALYLRLPGQTERVSLDGYFSPGGFSEEDRLWPKGESAFSGYQLLLEYFTFREKFMFVQLNGLENITLPAGISHFTLEVVFSEVWQSDLPVSASSLRLHCVPVINLFTLEADPLTISGLESEYLLRPKRLQDGHTEIYSVDSVTGSGRTGEARYVPFTRFRHQGGMMRRHAPERYYHTRVKRGVTGMHDTWLILGGQQWEADRALARETVSLRITGTNGQLPRRALQSTLLDRCESISATPLTVRNLCKPTLPVYPPAEDRYHWRVMSHLGTRFLNMMSSAEVLRGTLSLYNWREDELNNRRLDAILAVSHHRIQRFEQGFLLRGLDIEVTLDGSGFTGAGDVHLFGNMLNRFFALYADMNQFNQLTLIVQPEGKCIRWKENHSLRLPG